MLDWFARHPTALLLLSLALVLAGAAGLFAWWVLRPVGVRVPDRLPDGFPEQGFSHAAFEGLLTRFVNQRGEVDYQAWSQDSAAGRELDAYLGALARYSPRSAPARFPAEADQLAYWLYAYNACTIKGVLVNWPLKSVRDVKAPVNVVAGLAFFGKLQFLLGGEAFTLHALENSLIRKQFPDPRIHFVLNCASDGCPVIRPELPTGEALEPFLAKAAREFVSDSKHVQLDHTARRLRVSAIFDWYRSDFLNDLARRGVPPAERTLLAYLLVVASEERRAELEAARGYELEVLPYGWGVNAAD